MDKEYYGKRDKLNQLTTEFLSQRYQGQTHLNPNDLSLHLYYFCSSLIAKVAACCVNHKRENAQDYLDLLTDMFNDPDIRKNTEGLYNNTFGELKDD